MRFLKSHAIYILIFLVSCLFFSCQTKKRSLEELREQILSSRRTPEHIKEAIRNKETVKGMTFFQLEASVGPLLYWGPKGRGFHEPYTEGRTYRTSRGLLIIEFVRGKVESWRPFPVDKLKDREHRENE